jgi:O-succinylbenzoate synthase
MRIASITGFRYRLPLVAPLALGAHTIPARDGILVRVKGAEGPAGWGDVAPLPGFSTESIETAQRDLEAAAPSLVGQTAAAALDRVAAWAGASSVRCGLEMALFDAQARDAGRTLPHVLGADPRPVVAFNALVTEGTEGLAKTTKQLRATGYRAVKLKVGRRSVEDDIARVRAVHEQRGTMALRLDANRAWSLEAARRFAEAVADVPIDYIEEPLGDPGALPRLASETSLPVALDETIQAGAVPGDHPYAAAVILKPTLVGGMQAAQRLAHEAARLGIQPVLSASFESGVGLRALVALAAGLGTKDVPMGLDTFRRLQADVIQPRLPLNGPHVTVEGLFSGTEQLNATVIEEERSLTP